MEITLEAILSAIGLLTGGGFGTFFTWRWFKKKAKAEAVNAEIDAAKNMQDMYQQMLSDAKEEREDRKHQVEELRAERDHYKADRNELRERVEKLQTSIFEWKDLAENDRAEMKQKIARLGRKVDAMAPFMCGNLQCKLRQRVTISDDGEVRTKKSSAKKNNIEPSNEVI